MEGVLYMYRLCCAADNVLLSRTDSTTCTVQSVLKCVQSVQTEEIKQSIVQTVQRERERERDTLGVATMKAK